MLFVYVLNGPTPKANKTLALDYIQQYQQMAIMEMYRTKIPASITMAQALHESNKGTSSLATSAKNHFGIKCKSYWKGGTYYHKDDDLNDRGQLIESCFRSYETVIDSYVDHSNFLKYGENYQSLFILSPKDHKGWAHGLKRAGYATDPLYAEKLIKIIKEYGLEQLDHAENPYAVLKQKRY